MNTTTRTDSIRTEVREVEKHIKSIANTKAEQIAIISRAQGLVSGDESIVMVLALVKNRIIRS